MLLFLAGCYSEPVSDTATSADLSTTYTPFSISRDLPRAGEGGFTPDLEAEIEALLEDFDANGQTTVETAPARSMVLYDWANAMAISGEWIHPDIPSLAAVLQEPRFANLNPRMQAGLVLFVDIFVREFRLRREQPDAFGQITMDILKPAIVNDFHSVEMTYRVGSEPLRVGGGIVVPNHFRFADFQYQTSEPDEPNYITIRTSNPTVSFEEASFPVTGQYSANLRGTSPRLMFAVSAGQLDPGDTVTVTFGDMSKGSPGLQTLHYSNSAMRYPVWVLTKALEEGGILHALPELPVPLMGGAATGVQGFAPAMASIDEDIEITVRTEDQFRNRAEAEIPRYYEIRLNGEVIDRIATNGQPLVRYRTSFGAAGTYRLSFRSENNQITGVSSPILVEDNPSRRIFWGETHGHSGWAEGLGLVNNYFEFARDESRLDFITLSEHDLWMDLGEWAQMRQAVERYQKDGEFVTFMGYEWTAEPPYGGHHNVLFRNPETAVLAARQYYADLPALYEGLEAGVDENDVLVVPHAHQPGDWTQSHPEMERLVEIVSYHGTFEWFGRNYLNQGWEVGFIGSSDDHVGSPGYRPRALGSPGSDNFGGLAAVYAPQLDQDSVFDALRNRLAYATNGARIILQTSLNGQDMGTRLPVDTPVRTLTGRVIGTAPISSITLVKNGDDFQTFDYSQSDAANTIELGFQFSSEPPTRRRSLPDATFIGTLETKGLSLSRARAPVAEALNSETEYAQLNEDGSISFRLRSGGRFNTIELELNELPSADASVTIDLSNSQLTLYGAGRIEPFSIDIADLHNQSFLKILDDENRLYSVMAKLIDQPVEQDRAFEFVDGSSPMIGDYYYLRVRQSDGGMAWSSPWWIGEPIRRDSGDATAN